MHQVRFSILALGLALASLWPSHVTQAQGAIYDAQSGTWVRQPARTLYVSPRRPPDVVIRVPPRVIEPVIIDPPEQPIVPEPESVETGLVVGAGFGALGSLRRRGRAGIAAELHLGLERGATEFDLSFLFAPSALGADVTASVPQGGGIYGAAARLAYRPWHHLRLHPVVGLGFEALFANADQEESHAAFGVVGRLGAEVTFPMESGRLGVGLDGTLHQAIAGSAAFPKRASSLYGFGAHLDYRFGRP